MNPENQQIINFGDDEIIKKASDYITFNHCCREYGKDGNIIIERENWDEVKKSQEIDELIDQDLNELKKKKKLDQFNDIDVYHMLQLNERELVEEIRQMSETPKMHLSIFQGNIGNCYLIATICAIAKFPDYIKQNIITITKKRNNRIRFKFYIGGKEELVSSSSIVPAKMDRFKEIIYHFSYTSNDKNIYQVWEIAYSMRIGGFIESEDRDGYDSLFELTGYPVKEIPLKGHHMKEFREDSEDNNERINNEFDELCQLLSDKTITTSAVISTPYDTEIAVDNHHFPVNHCMTIIGTIKIGRIDYMIIRDQANVVSDSNTKESIESKTKELKEKFGMDEEESSHCFLIKYQSIKEHFHSIHYIRINEEFDKFTSYQNEIHLVNANSFFVEFRTKNKYFIIINPLEVHHSKKERKAEGGETGKVDIKLTKTIRSQTEIQWTTSTRFDFYNYLYSDEIDSTEETTWKLELTYNGNQNVNYFKRYIRLSFRSINDIEFN